MSDTDAVERRVQALLELGRVDDAIHELTPAIASDPTNAALLVMLSEALLRAGRAAEAERAARDAITRAPQWASSYRALGRALNDLADPSGALGAFEHAVAIDPGDPTSMFYVALARAKTRDAAGAHAAALEVKRLTSGAALGFHAAGFVDIQLGQWADAEREYRDALRLAPTSADYLNNLGLAVLRQGRTQEATEIFARAGELAPTSERLRKNTLHAAQAHTWMFRRLHLQFGYRWRWALFFGWLLLLQSADFPNSVKAVGLVLLLGLPLLYAIVGWLSLPPAARHIMRTDMLSARLPSTWPRPVRILFPLFVGGMLLALVLALRAP